MQRNKKVQRVPKRVNINIGVIIFIIILLYTGINVYLYITKPQVSIYQVSEQSLAQNNLVTGIITREESAVIADRSGYVNYYFRDGSKVAKDATVYSLDENKKIYDKLSDYSMNVVMSDEDIKDVKSIILKYKNNMPKKNFAYTYDFKDDLSNMIQEVIDDNLLSNMQSIIKETGMTTSFEVVTTPVTGVISYYADNYTGLKETGITPEIFDQNNYIRKNLRT
ncbi:MAG: HlyD family efflux transporter periplasmic adaptor subunit, partial [Clostridiales bacterium]|nr:HlyD family efflux transporter periplasmic adaptor subunit [Clostridiales bacterium]